MELVKSRCGCRHVRQSGKGPYRGTKLPLMRLRAEVKLGNSRIKEYLDLCVYTAYKVKV